MPLPPLAVGKAEEEVSIRFGRVDQPPLGYSEKGYSYFGLAPEEGCLFWKEVGSFLVRGGSEIIIDPFPGVDESMLRLFVLGPVLAVLLRQRGRLLLHASAVAVGGKAVVFLGCSGQGKSTIAATLHDRGHGLVTDDVAVLGDDEGRPIIFPGFPQLKLWPEALVSLGDSPEKLPRWDPHFEKRTRPATNRFSPTPLPIKRIYVLSEGTTSEILPLRPREAFMELVRHTYGSDYALQTVMGVGSASHFLKCGSIMNKVVICSLKRQNALSRLPNLARLIEKDLTQSTERVAGVGCRPEAELLLCCARTTRSPEATARIKTLLLRQSIDWEYVLRTAHRHGVAPLLYWHLGATGTDAVPKNVLDRLRDHFHANSMRNLFLTRELLRILNVLGAHGIAGVPYKGPALASFVYSHLSLREFYDLDILIRLHDVPKAKAVLASIGYQAHYQLTRAQEAAFLRSQSEHPFTRSDGMVNIELHWRIAEKHFFPLDAEGLWGRLNQISLMDTTVLNLSPEDMVLILCVHGARHAWERLGWVCDISELVNVCQDIEWERVLAQASALDGERMLRLGLFLASDLLGTALPERVSQEVGADLTVKALAKRTSEQLFRETGYQGGRYLEGYEGAPVFHNLHLKVRERLRDKIRYCVHQATTLRGEDWKLLSLPKVLFPFYYVLRTIRLARKYGPKTLKRFL